MHIFGILESWQALEIQGPDARDFLHRLSSVNFKFLRPPAFSPGTLLAHTGKVQLYFKAIALADRYLILLPPMTPGAKAAREGFDAFEKMHFREDFKLTPREDHYTYFRILGSDPSALEKNSALAQVAKLKKGSAHQDGECITLNEDRWNHPAWGDGPQFQYDLGLIIPKAKESETKAALQKMGFKSADLEEFRLRAGDPAAPHEINTGIIALEAHLDDALHENKGCYPGQEVIERIRSMGQAPRKLVSFQGSGPAPAIPAKIQVDTTEAGQLTSAVAGSDGHWYGLGLVKKMHATANAKFTIAGAAVAHKLVEEKTT